jgi:hypothetical protein
MTQIHSQERIYDPFHFPLILHIVCVEQSDNAKKNRSKTMANVSDAQGNIRISVETDSFEILERAVTLINDSFREGAYPTMFLNVPSHKNNMYDLTSCDVKKDGKCLTVEDSFFADGRWTYETNIESFGNWLDYSYGSDNENRKFLENLTFDIHYDFVDYEPGLQVFYKAEALNHHQAGKPLTETTAEITNEEEIDYTLDNAFEYGMEDPESVIDFNQPREDVKDFFAYNFSIDPKLFDDDSTYQAMKDAFGDEWIWESEDSEIIKETINRALGKQKAEKAEKDELER